jgi:hypothetical protein
MKRRLPLYSALLVLLCAGGCINPFAPRLDTSPLDEALDPRTVPGVFRKFQKAYSNRDTTSYGELLDSRFTFVYRDYEQQIDVSWGRDEELRATYGMFQSAQRIDLIWNDIVSTTEDSTQLNVIRSFTLTVMLNPTDILTAAGIANVTLERKHSTDPWKMIAWRDESNY